MKIPEKLSLVGEWAGNYGVINNREKINEIIDYLDHINPRKHMKPKKPESLTVTYGPCEPNERLNDGDKVTKEKFIGGDICDSALPDLRSSAINPTQLNNTATGMSMMEIEKGQKAIELMDKLVTNFKGCEGIPLGVIWKMYYEWEKYKEEKNCE